LIARDARNRSARPRFRFPLSVFRFPPYHPHITSAAAAQTPTRLLRPLFALVTLVFLAVLIRTAWMSDDGAITLRTVLNVTHGFGLRFNVAERVQTFTHPLWLGLITLVYLAVGNIYASTFLLSIALSVIVFLHALTRAES